MFKNKKILVVIADQLRADCVEGALAAHVNLPNIQAFRQEAVTFTNHFTVTCPCGPSRVSILTGQYTMNHRSIRNGTPLANHIPTLATEMRKSGYDPMLFGYTDTAPDPNFHHPNDPVLWDEEGLMRGFNEKLEMRADASYPWRAHLKAKGYSLPDYKKFSQQVSPDPTREAELTDPPFYRAEDSDTAFLTDELLKDLSVRDHQNWSAFATYFRPHPPFVAPAPYNTMFDPASLPLPARRASVEDERAEHPIIDGCMDWPILESITRGFEGRMDHTNDTQIQTLRALYFGLATELDTHFGRIIQFLKDTDQYDDTIVVFTADHGEMLGEHHLWGKETPYDSSFRIPLIIHDPSNPAEYGKSVDAMTESVDFMPTLLDLIGQAIPAGVDGVSLQPFLAGEQPENWRDYVHIELNYAEPNEKSKKQLATGTTTNDSNFSILRESRFKLVHFNGDLQPMLFDLEIDPDEMQNLAGDPAYMPELLRLTQKLLNHKMRYNDHTMTDVRIGSNGASGFNP